MQSSRKDNFRKFRQFVIDQDHPCLMAQSVFRGSKLNFHEYKGFGTAANAGIMLKSLDRYLASIDLFSNDVYSFIAAFPEDRIHDEMEFEEKLWKQLHHLHKLDEFPWDPKVDKDPDKSNFSFSLRGHAFYVIGMHPDSSRKARQSPFPAMVFNLHSQFEKLREMGVYDSLKQHIRTRDLELQGSINPMLADFGHDSEARQYSGREVDRQWKCPFHHKNE